MWLLSFDQVVYPLDDKLEGFQCMPLKTFQQVL